MGSGLRFPPEPGPPCPVAPEQDSGCPEEGVAPKGDSRITPSSAAMSREITSSTHSEVSSSGGPPRTIRSVMVRSLTRRATTRASPTMPSRAKHVTR